MRISRRAVVPAEHATLEVTRVELGFFVGAPITPAVQDVDGGRVEVDAAARGAGLAARLVELVADGDEGAGDGEARGVEVDVASSQSEHLTASHPGVRRQPQAACERCVLVEVRKARSCWAFHTLEVLLDSGRRFGACAMCSGLETSSPRRTASSSARRSTM
jgi:hypothetical protein